MAAALTSDGAGRMERARGRAGPEGGARAEAAPGDVGGREALPALRTPRRPRVNERTAGGP